MFAHCLLYTIEYRQRALCAVNVPRLVFCALLKLDLNCLGSSYDFQFNRSEIGPNVNYKGVGFFNELTSHHIDSFVFVIDSSVVDFLLEGLKRDNDVLDDNLGKPLID